MRYIGSKQKLAPWIFETVKTATKLDLRDVIFADLFAGTGSVSRYFKKHVKQIIINDLEKYSFILNSHYIGNSFSMREIELQKEEVEGLFYHNFTEKAILPKKYFTVENALLIDGYRTQIENLLNNGSITQKQYVWLLTSLMEALDKVANTTSVYATFLKDYRSNALNTIDFKLAPYEITEQNNLVFHGDANHLIKEISGDILYLDPPYNRRQYGANYHILNKLLEYQDFHSDKPTGITDYQKSNYCKKGEVFNELKSLISNADFEHIFISYSNEGVIKENDLKNLLSTYGEYRFYSTEHMRFKSNTKGNKKHSHTFEHLHYLRKK